MGMGHAPGAALKDIVVFLDGSPDSGVRLEIAVDIARRHRAVLIGAYVADEAVLARHPDEFARGSAVESVARRESSSEDEDAATAATRFAAAIRKRGVEGEWRPVAKYGTAADIVRCARYADLSIVGQFGGRETNALWRPEELLFAFGGPALIVPRDSSSSHRVGKHILIAWNASREAKRAVADAMPFLAGADRTTILVVEPREPSNEHDDAGAALSLRLERRGIAASVRRIPTDGRNVGTVILEQAQDCGADMIVMGAYGHMRIIEMVFGGATHTVLSQMTLPVLMSH